MSVPIAWPISSAHETVSPSLLPAHDTPTITTTTTTMAPYMNPSSSLTRPPLSH